MKTSSQRILARTIHIGSGTMIGVYFYSPLGQNDGFLALVRFLVIPIVTISGLWIWKSEAIRRWINQRDGLHA